MYKKLFFFFSLLIFLNSSLFGYTPEFITQEQLNKVKLIYGNEGKNRLIQFDKMLKTAQNKDVLTKLTIVNNFFNSLTYKDDSIHWKEKDYWAPPFEFIGSGAGDCEDFAIGKYFALRLLGIESSKLKVTFAFVKKRSKKDAIHHVVLNYYHNPTLAPVVLDNINKRLQLATKRKDLNLLNSVEIAKLITLQTLFWS